MSETFSYQSFHGISFSSLRELEARNQELCLQCGNLERENAVLQRDAEELQTEVGELQLLVEDLRNRVRIVH